MSPSFSYPSPNTLSLHFKVGDKRASLLLPQPSRQSATSQGLDLGLSPCTGKATDPKAPTLHLEGMLIQTKSKGSKTTMAVLEQMALCCLWKLKINPDLRTRKYSNTAATLHIHLPAFEPLRERLLGLNVSSALTYKSQVASSSRRSLSLNFKTSE